MTIFGLVLSAALVGQSVSAIPGQAQTQVVDQKAGAPAQSPPDSPSQVVGPQEACLQPIEGTTVSLQLRLVPGSKDGSVKPFLAATTEVPWELFDICVFGLDQVGGKSSSSAADATTRPTKPYISVDRGFGHAGWPAISISFTGAQAFCAWLAAKTGKPYRLPTEAEWSHMCQNAGIDASEVEASAWHIGNASRTTHKVATRTADDLKLFDLLGNVGEWAVAADGTGVVMGGSFNDEASKVGCSSRLANTPEWNDSDPQFPKSQWWLADANFVGLRVVCDAP